MLSRSSSEMDPPGPPPTPTPNFNSDLSPVPLQRLGWGTGLAVCPGILTLRSTSQERVFLPGKGVSPGRMPHAESALERLGDDNSQLMSSRV